MSAAPAPALIRDPYEFQPDEVEEPPRSFLGILRRIGPGIILSASIVGSGELIATTTLGAEVGYIAMWIIVLSCLIKPAVQSEMGRYIIATGKTGAEGFNHMPGARPGGINWAVWMWAFMILMTMFQIGAMFGGVAQVLNLLWPAIPIPAWIIALLALSLVLLLGGGYERIEKIATVKVGLFTMLTMLCALIMMRQPGSFTWQQLKEGFEFQMPGAGNHGQSRRIRPGADAAGAFGGRAVYEASRVAEGHRAWGDGDRTPLVRHDRDQHSHGLWAGTDCKVLAMTVLPHLRS